MRKKKIILLLFMGCHIHKLYGWGFLAHKQINKYAITTLPPAMFSFYKCHRQFITENAVNPDKRRYVVVGEAAKHHIDVEAYEDSKLLHNTYSWKEAIAIYGIEKIGKHGSLPWSIIQVKGQLTAAFKNQDVPQILRLSADLGHYIADAHVPLHTTCNYNGQLTGQNGIHAFWETRLPELFIKNYNFFVGKAQYIAQPQKKIWEIIKQSHIEVSHILSYENQLNVTYPSRQKYSFEQQESTFKKVYSEGYATAYHKMLNGQVEQRMRDSIYAVGSFWLTCWVDAGEPDLNILIKMKLPATMLEEKFPEEVKLKIRDCSH